METTSPSAEAAPARKKRMLWIALGVYLVFMLSTGLFAEKIPVLVLVAEGLINGALFIVAVVAAVNWARKRSIEKTRGPDRNGGRLRI